MTFYPQYAPNPGSQLQPLTGEQRAAAWRDYQQACKVAYFKGPHPATFHILWLLVTVFTFGLGAIPWIILAIQGVPTLRPGMYAPQWPPPGYYLPR